MNEDTIYVFMHKKREFYHVRERKEEGKERKKRGRKGRRDISRHGRYVEEGRRGWNLLLLPLTRACACRKEGRSHEREIMEEETKMEEEVRDE